MAKKVFLKESHFVVGDVSFYYGKDKEGKPNAKRFISMKGIDYGRVVSVNMSLEQFQKDPSFADKSEEIIKAEVLGKSINITTDIFL